MADDPHFSLADRLAALCSPVTACLPTCTLLPRSPSASSLPNPADAWYSQSRPLPTTSTWDDPDAHHARREADLLSLHEGVGSRRSAPRTAPAGLSRLTLLSSLWRGWWTGDGAVRLEDSDDDDDDDDDDRANVDDDATPLVLDAQGVVRSPPPPPPPPVAHSRTATSVSSVPSDADDAESKAARRARRRARRQARELVAPVTPHEFVLADSIAPPSSNGSHWLEYNSPVPPVDDDDPQHPFGRPTTPRAATRTSSSFTTSDSSHLSPTTSHGPPPSSPTTSAHRSHPSLSSAASGSTSSSTDPHRRRRKHKPTPAAARPEWDRETDTLHPIAPETPGQWFVDDRGGKYFVPAPVPVPAPTPAVVTSPSVAVDYSHIGLLPPLPDSFGHNHDDAEFGGPGKTSSFDLGQEDRRRRTPTTSTWDGASETSSSSLTLESGATSWRTAVQGQSDSEDE